MTINRRNLNDAMQSGIINSGLRSAAIVAGACGLLLGGLSLAPAEAEAQLRKPATTAKSATRRKPSATRSRYSNRVTARKAVENVTKTTSRHTAQQSSFGDGRRNAVRLARSPIPESGASSSGSDTRRDGVHLVGSPVTSWSGWNRAASREAATVTQRQAQRTSQSGRRITFRAAGKSG